MTAAAAAAAAARVVYRAACLRALVCLPRARARGDIYMHTCVYRTHVRNAYQPRDGRRDETYQCTHQLIDAMLGTELRCRVTVHKR